MACWSADVLATTIKYMNTQYAVNQKVTVDCGEVKMPRSTAFSLSFSLSFTERNRVKYY